LSVQVIAREEELRACKAKLGAASAEVRGVKQLLTSSLQPRLPTQPLPKLISLDRIAASASSRGDTLGFAALQRSRTPAHRRSASEHAAHGLLSLGHPCSTPPTASGRHSRTDAALAASAGGSLPSALGKLSPGRCKGGERNEVGVLEATPAAATVFVSRQDPETQRDLECAALGSSAMSPQQRTPVAQTAGGLFSKSPIRLAEETATAAAADSCTAISRLKGMLRRPAVTAGGADVLDDAAAACSAAAESHYGKLATGPLHMLRGTARSGNGGWSRSKTPLEVCVPTPSSGSITAAGHAPTRRSARPVAPATKDSCVQTEVRCQEALRFDTPK
jgi:hypothetical protein